MAGKLDFWKFKAFNLHALFIGDVFICIKRYLLVNLIQKVPDQNPYP